MSQVDNNEARLEVECRRCDRHDDRAHPSRVRHLRSGRIGTGGDLLASPQGAGTACSSGSPCSLSQLISKVQAGDIGIVNAGTYTGNINISAKSGTAAEPITLRAQNFAVTCTDPVNDPDGCQVANTASRSFLKSDLALL